MRTLASRARAMSAADYERIHTALDAGNTYERHIGLHLAVVRRDLNAVERALADPVLRRRALSASIRLPVSDRALTALVEHSTARDRTAVYGVLRRSRRRELADALVPLVRDRYGRADVARLLPACSPKVVEHWLPLAGSNTTLLRRLARTAPAVVARHLVSELPTQDWRRRNGGLLGYRGVLDVLATRAPRELASVLRNHPGLRQVALTRDPRMTSALLTEPEAILDAPSAQHWPIHHDVRLSSGARNAIAGLDVEQVARLLRKFAALPVRGRVLEAMPPHTRRRVLERAYPDEQVATHVTVDEVRQLPPEDRVGLARRILADLERPTCGWRHLEMTGMLPYPEAAPALSEATASHRYQERRLAWESLLGCAVLEGDRTAFSRAVTEARRAWYDQDLVRVAALRPIAHAPTALLSAVPVSVPREVVAAVTGSRDATETCFSLVSRWLSRSLAHASTETSAERAEELQALLVRLHGDSRSPRPPVEVAGRDLGRRLWSQLRSRLDHQVRSGRFDAVFRLAAMVEPGSIPELDELLGTISRTATEPRDAAEAAKLWIAAPSTREDRVGELVEHDPALGRIECVWQVVATRRTDLLDRVLSRDKAPPAVPAGRRGRWTPTQRQLAEAGATTAAFDADLPMVEREMAVAALSDPDSLTALADSAAPPVAAAALGTLARVAPAGQALHVLLRHATEDGGPARRAAVRALAECVDSLPDSRAIEALRPFVLGRKSVGAAKEAVRLLAGRRLVGGTDLLVAAWRTPDLHRDARAAVVAALVGVLGEDDRVPAILGEAVRGGEAVRAPVLDLRPAEVTGDQRPVLARTLAGALDTRDAEVIGAYAEWWQYAPGGLAGLDPVAAVTAPPTAFGAMASLLCRAARHDDGLRALRAVTDQLTTEIGNGSATARKHLEKLLSCWSIPTQEQKEAGAARVLADACKRVDMHAAAVPLLMHLARLSLAGPPEPDSWTELVATIDERPYRWKSYGLLQPPLRPDELDTALAVADHLSTLDGSVPGLLAVQLVLAGRRLGDRTGSCRDRLAALREHPDPDVRECLRGKHFWQVGW
ncbi:hypothetical protein A8924_5153 [Saccharopolyspora erythraea NRRL 2338]|uniref:Uncharacterized protein n=3 Tax=Saccharopolyspora erythraea TaxID=1836 RepID=A4FJ13_SACEN|nr:hypothetical protein A8924_5153 [Saccharopolyspora erythraea NRRL 2338]QRK87857.1 hypothetical protein JQX30_24245 [Saccharopolyspora erythraea]CAM04038.1 hypothetical protein SACE_4770 [Saccharopolyspora erythraea NRRL 2338]